MQSHEPVADLTLSLKAAGPACQTHAELCFLCELSLQTEMRTGFCLAMGGQQHLGSSKI